MRAVLDTNVLISALFWDGLPRRVVDSAASGRFEAVTSGELLAELAEVLADSFGVPDSRLDHIIRDVLSYASVVSPAADIETAVRDVGDVKVLACAVAGEVDFIVTGDRDLLSLGSASVRTADRPDVQVAVLSVADFWELLSA